MKTIVDKDTRKLNIRVNSHILSDFKNIAIKKGYTVASFSKQLLKEYDYDLSCSKEQDIAESLFIECNGFSNKLDKTYTLHLNSSDASILLNLSNKMGISYSECFRRIILTERNRNVFLYPQPYNDLASGKKKDDTNTKFRLYCNKDILNSFRETYFKATGENNLTVALNDIVKKSIDEIKENPKSFVNNLTNIPNKEKIANLKNNYKYNFTISNKRYEKFLLHCEEIGLSHQECLRKSVAIYISKNKREKVNI